MTASSDSTPSSDLTADEMFESLTGYDEIAIAQHFGAEITDLAEHRQLAFMRALVFVHLRREGSKDREAKTAALDLTIAQVNDCFAEAVDDNSEDPVTPVGEGGDGYA